MTSIVDISFRPPSHERLEVEVLDIGELRKRAPPEHFKQWLRADFFRLYAVRSGITRPVVDFIKRPLSAGDWLLVHPGQVLLYDFEQTWEGDLVVFQRQAVWEDRLQQAQASQWRAQLALAQGGVWHLGAAQHQFMLEIVRTLRGGIPDNVSMALHNEVLRLQLTALLLRLMATPNQADIHTSAASQAWVRFVLLLEEHFAAQHQVAYYADKLGMHEKTLTRVVQAHAGARMSPKKCISQRLILEAKRLLAHTQQSVQTIGLTLGFDDPSNFVKFFRQQVGTSPQAFRTELG